MQFNNSALGLMQLTNGNQINSYTRTLDGAPVGMRSSGQHYYTHDHLGSVIGIFTATGAYSGGSSYSPDGESRATSSDAAVTTDNLRYIGEHHAGAGVYKLGARYYDTAPGPSRRWIPAARKKFLRLRHMQSHQWE